MNPHPVSAPTGRMPRTFGIALMTSEGSVLTAGDIQSEVSIQSSSRLFILARLIEQQGPDVRLNAKDLATLAATLANEGKNPVSGERVIDADSVPYLLSVMTPAGIHRGAGIRFYHTGLPDARGAGGGIMAVAPGRFGVGLISPPLDQPGQILQAKRVLTEIIAGVTANLSPGRSQPMRPIGWRESERAAALG